MSGEGVKAVIFLRFCTGIMEIGYNML